MSSNITLMLENSKTLSRQTLVISPIQVGESRLSYNPSLILYLIFISSWFLHLGTRVPLLGLIRIDLFLVCVLTCLVLCSKAEREAPRTITHKLLALLIAYSVLTLPFVEWPGSVIRAGIPELIKAVVFYYFTVAFVRTEKDLKKVIVVFVSCQLWRILEPLYLHITQGYWGGIAYMIGGAEALNRLSGAPSDVVNPNGLAFIICTVLPFLYLIAGLSWKFWIASSIVTPACIYALVLTGSRSGLLGLAIMFLAILVKSTRRFLWGLSGAMLLVVGFPLLNPDMQDRYMSIIGAGEKNAATAEGRVSGVEDSFVIALRRPIFGHGLGTSREANANFAGKDQPAHNLYGEVAQELGFVGLGIYLLFLKSIYTGFAECKRIYNRQDASAFLTRLVDALQLFLFMNLLFSFASYGLSSYEWYLLGAFSVAIQRLALGTSSDMVGTPVGLK